MEQFFAVAAFVLLVFVVAFLYYIMRKFSSNQPKTDDSKAFIMMQNQIQELARMVDSKLTETHKAMNETQHNLNKTVQAQFGQSVKAITEITEKLTKLDETNKQVISFTDQLQSLQDILKNPKQRGILGEYYLETLLKNVLPGNYQMQYKFKDSEIVDAVVFVKDKLIPIDSKFSLENYNRLAEEKDKTEKDRLEKTFVNDLKLRIQETSKYIRPDEGTLDFAFMFIPHEAIYYDLLINRIGAIQEDTENLIQRAASKYHVIIVSPTSFLAYLQTVLQGLKALQIEESAKEIRKNIEQLGKHLVAYDTYMQKMGNTLGTTVSHYNNAYKEFKKIDTDVVRIAGGEKSIEPMALEKPTTEVL